MTMTTTTPTPNSGIPAVFLDRDGVLIEDCGYPHLEEHLVLIPGAAEAVVRLNRAGYLAVIVTNQSGVARGMFSLETMQGFNRMLVRKLGAKGGIIGATYACPYHSDGTVAEYVHPDHPDRKPNPGMLLTAIADHDIDPARSFMIGDKPSDMEAARRAGVSGFMFDGPDLDAFVRDLLGG